jgi:hypothetical protein
MHGDTGVNKKLIKQISLSHIFVSLSSSRPSLLTSLIHHQKESRESYFDTQSSARTSTSNQTEWSVFAASKAAAINQLRFLTHVCVSLAQEYLGQQSEVKRRK